MVGRCPRCGHGFVQGEPFVRAEPLQRVHTGPREAKFVAQQCTLFHVRCAPWGDPKYRIARRPRT